MDFSANYGELPSLFNSFLSKSRLNISDEYVKSIVDISPPRMTTLFELTCATIRFLLLGKISAFVTLNLDHYSSLSPM